MNTSFPTQTTLIEPKRLLTPASHGPFHYVPVIKTLPGEFRALHRVDARVWNRMTPLIEPTTKENEDEIPGARSMLARFGAEAHDIFGIDRPFFIDPRWLPLRAQIDLGGFRRPAITHVLAECRSYALQAIPVLSLEDSPVLRSLIEKTVGFERGVCIRVAFSASLSATGITLGQQIERVLEEVGVKYAHADLFLDLGYLEQDPGFSAADVVRRLRTLGDMARWRSVILAGTVIPPDLSGWPENAIRQLKRHEVAVWLALGKLSASRWPTYGDYLIQHPKPPQGKPRGMKANIRYPTRDEVIIVRGTALNRGSVQQYRRLAAMLCARPEFAGAAFSWGDGQIDACAKGLVLPRRAEDWREIGTDRHLKLTAETLASHEAA